MNTKLGLGLLLWEAFAFALALTLALVGPVPGGSSWNGDTFWGVFLSVTFFGLALFLLVTGVVDYFKRKYEE